MGGLRTLKLHGFALHPKRWSCLLEVEAGSFISALQRSLTSSQGGFWFSVLTALPRPILKSHPSESSFLIWDLRDPSQSQVLSIALEKRRHLLARKRARNLGCAGETPGGHPSQCVPRCPPDARAPPWTRRPALAAWPRRRARDGRGERARRARALGQEERGPGLTFLSRLHVAAGGRRGPQSFSSPADCGRRAEWKLGRDWKAGTWHPRGGGGSGEQQEEE